MDLVLLRSNRMMSTALLCSPSESQGTKNLNLSSFFRCLTRRNADDLPVQTEPLSRTTTKSTK